MSTQPRRQGVTPTALVGGGCLVGALWAVVIALAARGTTPLVLIAPVLASIALAFAYGVWLGGRGVDEARAAGDAKRALVELRLRNAVARQAAIARQLGLLLEQIAPAAALFDASGGLVSWTREFSTMAELPNSAMAAGRSLAELVRLQPDAPDYRLPIDEVVSGAAGNATRLRIDGGVVEDRWTPLADGGLLVTSRATVAAPSLAAVREG